jgi:hypothetical protein
VYSRPGRHTERNKSGQESQRTRGTNKLRAQRDKSGDQIKTGELEGPALTFWRAPRGGWFKIREESEREGHSLPRERRERVSGGTKRERESEGYSLSGEQMRTT